MSAPEPRAAGRIERLLRELAPQVLGATLRRFRDFAACEDAVQEALIAAASQWPRDGIPDNPRGWLIQVALRRMTDHVRSEISRRYTADDVELAEELARRLLEIGYVDMKDPARLEELVPVPKHARHFSHREMFEALNGADLVDAVGLVG